MISAQQFQALRRYPTSSWAVWNENGSDDLAFFERQLHRLKADVVFVGLNRSGPQRVEDNQFQNFHLPGHRGDLVLRRALQNQNLQFLLGAYMTDLSAVFETDSRKVTIDIERSGDLLEEQIAVLGGTNVALICFGDLAFRSLAAFYGATVCPTGSLKRATAHERDVFGVYHYSMNGFNNRNASEKLPEQLCQIDRILTERA